MRPSPRKRLAVALPCTATATTIAATWWWALFGMDADVGIAWITTVTLTLSAGGALAALEIDQ